MNQLKNPKYPEIRVPLSDEDGNAFFILVRVRKALRRAGVPERQIWKFSQEARSGDYDHLLQTCMKWVDCR